MLSVNFSLFVTLVLLIITSVSCEDLTPVKKEEFSSEGSTLTLSYRYCKKADGYDYYFFWYQQYPGKPPDFLISHSGTGEILNNPVPGLSVKQPSSHPRAQNTRRYAGYPADRPTGSARRRRRDRKQRRGKCGGLRAKLKLTPHRLSLTSIFLTNVRSLANKMDELRLQDHSQQENYGL
ncbi:hypothetical protein L3Q82_021080 [Scortum barcoo]|uniref:Uncharacterized protein n=1 Tax=Scortum barcoo TaxID=214431 RepID=A0ACB8X5D8_9TELE|nr:hypothetical protein L3Q82_021080 [Scortum barcoo]